MKVTITLLIIALFTLICISLISFASADMYKTLGIKYKASPITCIFEPNHEHTSNPMGVLTAVETAVDNWEAALNKVSPDGNWYLLTTVIPFEYHDGLPASNFPVCDILISFEESNPEATSLGYAGINFSNSWHKYVHIVVFLNGYDNDLTITIPPITLGQNITYDEPIVIKLVQKEYPLIAIQNIVTHEFGHGLGLGHYSITDAPITNPWSRSAMYYAVDPFNEEILYPSYVDVKLTEKIYGKDGFGGKTVGYTPRVHWYTMGDEDLCSFKCIRSFD